MEDQRKEPRTHLIYYLRVYDPADNCLFGHVVDISKSGLLITSEKPIETHRQYHLKIEDATTFDDFFTVGVQAECRWCTGDASNSLYDAGFRLIDPSDQMSNMLASYH